MTRKKFRKLKRVKQSQKDYDAKNEQSVFKRSDKSKNLFFK